ncbi:hypothetical protein D3C81_1711690 [compost metagenome]
MKKTKPETKLISKPPSSGLSAQELASFLEGLAAVHSSPKLGNRDLSLALLDLAQKVRQGCLGTTSHPRKKQNTTVPVTEEKLAELRNLDNEAIKKFISDKAKTKSDLIALASARFSMPTSQLKRSRVEDVRAAVTTALLHEISIEIISTEADKEGAKRTS